jgi:hypothetical protein
MMSNGGGRLIAYSNSLSDAGIMQYVMKEGKNITIKQGMRRNGGGEMRLRAA